MSVVKVTLGQTPTQRQAATALVDHEVAPSSQSAGVTSTARAAERAARDKQTTRQSSDAGIAAVAGGGCYRCGQ